MKNAENLDAKELIEVPLRLNHAALTKLNVFLKKTGSMYHPFVDKIEIFSSPSAVGYKLAQTDWNEIVQLKIHPGGKVESHVLPVNVVFYILSGKGKLTTGNNVLHGQKGDVLVVKANSGRCWENNSDDVLELLAIKQAHN